MTDSNKFKKERENQRFEIFVYEGHNSWHTRYNILDIPVSKYYNTFC